MIKSRSIYLILAGLVVVILVCSTILKKEQNTAYSAKGTLESVTGSSLYQVWFGYSTILQNKENSLDREHIEDLFTSLSVIEAHSQTVDQAVHAQVLTPIAKNMKQIADGIKRSYVKNGKLTEDDQASYSKMMKQSEMLISSLSKVYYVPDSLEGAEVTLDINKNDDYRKLLELNKELKQYIDSSKS